MTTPARLALALLALPFLGACGLLPAGTGRAPVDLALALCVASGLAWGAGVGATCSVAAGTWVAASYPDGGGGVLLACTLAGATAGLASSHESGRPSVLRCLVGATLAVLAHQVVLACWASLDWGLPCAGALAPLAWWIVQILLTVAWGCLLAALSRPRPAAMP